MDDNQKKYYENLKSLAEEKGFILLSEIWVTSRFKYKFKCKCGNEFNMRRDQFKECYKCPKCPSLVEIKAKEDFFKMVNNKGGEVIGKYINNDTNVEILCENKHIFLSTPSHIKGNRWCGKCSDNCPIQAEELFIQKVLDKKGILIGKYINAKSKVEILCDKGHIFLANPDFIKSKNGWCSKCANICPIQAKENFIKNVENRGGKIIGKYINQKNRIELLCENGHNFISIASSIKQGYWCSFCKNKTEAKVLEYLKIIKPSLELIPQYKKDWCKNPKTNYYLPYDFCFPSLKIIIEIDGRQHFEQVENWESANCTQLKDIYKMKQALKNNFSIIRISQKNIWEDKIKWKILLQMNLYYHENPTVIYFSNTNIYDIHKEKMKSDIEDIEDIEDDIEEYDTEYTPESDTEDNVNTNREYI